jgi:UPF0755 protein
LVTLLAFVVILALLGAGWFVIRPVIARQFAVQDWPGPGTGSVTVVVHPGDDASDIATTLVDAGVVRSTKAFTRAASADGATQNLQPGYYRMRLHMSGQQAVTLLLDPASRLTSRLTISEGMTSKDVVSRLAATLKVPVSQVQAAVDNIPALGLPTAYTVNGAPPKSAEGFLFPSTYDFDPSTSVSDALQQMTAQFASADRSVQFSAGAAALHVTPYQALIIASMVQAEAKFPQDEAKVARVIYNRLAAGTPLGIDATSVYAARLAGKDPATLTYTESTPYNTRNHTGLPPTPISNPGTDAMNAAIHPADGNWIYYVNADAAGHLFFTDDPAAFERAKDACRTNHWGCT